MPLHYNTVFGGGPVHCPVFAVTFDAIEVGANETFDNFAFWACRTSHQEKGQSEYKTICTGAHCEVGGSKLVLQNGDTNKPEFRNRFD